MSALISDLGSRPHFKEYKHQIVPKCTKINKIAQSLYRNQITRFHQSNNFHLKFHYLHNENERTTKYNRFAKLCNIIQISSANNITFFPQSKQLELYDNESAKYSKSTVILDSKNIIPSNQ